MKLFILETIVLQTQARAGPSAGERATATAMIENSDNVGRRRDVCSEASAGDLPQAATAAPLGMTAPRRCPAICGASRTTAAGLPLAVEESASAGGPLNASSQAYALGLMRNVEADQRWGVGSRGRPGTTFANKNGWLDIDDDGGPVAANSVGVLTVGGHQVPDRRC